MSGQAGYCWLHGHAQWTSTALAPKQNTACLDTGEVKVHLCLLNYFCITNWYLPSLVLQFVLPKSLFVPLYSELHQCNKWHTQDSSQNIPNLLLQQFAVCSGEGLMCLLPWINLLCVSLRTFQGHQTVRSLQYLYFIKDGAKRTLAICPATLNTGTGTEESLCSNWLVWKK